MIALTHGAATSAGRVRDHNEDDFFAGEQLFVVADGMGGHAAGEIAAGIAVSALKKLTERAGVQPSEVVESLDAVNEEIVWRSGKDAELAGMGTTATGLIAVQTGGVDHWMVFNIGDSRVYRWFGGELRQLTTDHSEVQELIGAGQISAAEARVHPRRNVVTRSLGITPPPKSDQWLMPPSLGERFLICSDGLTGELTDEEIADLLRGVQTPQECADALVARAVAAGGRDNVTVIIVEVVAVTDDGADEDTMPREPS